jgi:Zn-dependent protease/CBS domain-containing protein
VFGLPTVTLFRAFGIPIKLDASWLLVFGLVTWTLAAHVFPEDPALAGEDLAPAALYAVSAATAVLFFGSIVLHELGHAVVAIRNRLPIRGITLFVFGGVAELSREPETAGSEFRMAVAGPAVSAVLVGLFLGLGLGLPEGLLPAVPRAAARFLGFVNAGLVTFNLIPGFPLDGGRILRAAVWHFTGSLKRATRIATRLGLGLAYLLIALGAVEAIAGDAVIPGLWLAVMGLFLRQAAQASYDRVVIREGLEGLRTGDLLGTADAALAVAPDLPLDRLVAERLVRHRAGAYPVVAADGRPLGIVALGDIRSVPRERRPLTTVGEVMRRDAAVRWIAGTASAKDALEAMDGHPTVGVIGPDGSVRGLLTRRDIVEAARHRAELS